MNCVIPGRGIRAFGKAIYCLAKIGEELYIEALPDALALKTVNGARSAFASFLFQRKFFAFYRNCGRDSHQGSRHQQASEEEALKCKISIKSCVSVFKALSTLEKTVDRCSFYLDSQQNKLVFVFHCRHGIVKTHNLGFQECEALQAVFTKDLCPNHIIGPAKIVSEVVANFPSSLDEVTMIAEPECVRLKNYVEDEDGGSRVSLTEISLAPDEFDDYQIGVDTVVTFCLKELRALLVFTDAISHSLSIRFEAPGKPVVFSLDDSADYQADFVLATLLDESPLSQESSSDTQSCRSEVQGRKRAHGNHNNINGTSSQPADHDESHLEDSISIDQSHSVYALPQPTNSERQNRVPTKQAQDFTRMDFPSGSQFNNTKRTNSKSSTSKSPSEAHVPPAPHSMDTDFMDVEPSLPKSSVVSDKDKSVDFTTATRTEEIMDALFGAEDGAYVAEETVLKVNTSERREVRRKTSDHSKTSSEKITPGIAALPDRAHDVVFPDDFPFEADITNRIQPLSTSSRIPVCNEDSTQSEMQSTQDSIINDSGILPGTPPSKKFKRGSVMFEMDLFGHEPDISEVLAPDSEEDSD